MTMRATTLRFSDDLWELLERESAHQGISVAQFVRDATLMRAAVVLSSRGEADGDATLVRLARAHKQHAATPAALRDPGRLMAVRRSGLLDSPREARFDRLTRVAAGALGAPVALLAILDADRQFLKSCFGLREPWASEREMPLSHSFCQHAVGCPDPFVVADAREHPLLRDSRAISDLDAIAYLGIPLCSHDGHPLGTLCVIDHRRRDWSADEIALLRDVADTVAQEIQRQDARPAPEPLRSTAGPDPRAAKPAACH